MRYLVYRRRENAAVLAYFIQGSMYKHNFEESSTNPFQSSAFETWMQANWWLQVPTYYATLRLQINCTKLPTTKQPPFSRKLPNIRKYKRLIDDIWMLPNLEAMHLYPRKIAMNFKHLSTQPHHFSTCYSAFNLSLNDALLFSTVEYKYCKYQILQGLIIVAHLIV